MLDVVVRYQRLNPRPGANADHGTRGAPGFGARSPGSDHVILMRDRRSKSCEVSWDRVVYGWDPLAQPWLPNGVEGPLEAPGAYTCRREVWLAADGRAHAEQERPPLSVSGSLSSLAALVAEERGMTAPTGRVTDVAVWLDAQLDWVTRQDWVGDVDEVLRRLRSQLRPVTGDRKFSVAMPCPNTVDEGEHTRLCGAKLHEPDQDGVIACGSCGRDWPRDKWHGEGPEFLSQLAVDSRLPRRVA